MVLIDPLIRDLEHTYIWICKFVLIPAYFISITLVQAVNEVDVGAAGAWGEFTLIPWGLLYKVTRRIPLFDVGYTHLDR